MSKMNDDDRFKNVSYHTTDLRKTFARVRAKQREETAKKAADEAAESAKAVERLYVVYPGLRSVR